MLSKGVLSAHLFNLIYG
ncbi:hypothetical protein [Escherichia coli]|nr:hypothetical protein [Escherichia coli]